MNIVAVFLSLFVIILSVNSICDVNAKYFDDDEFVPCYDVDHNVIVGAVCQSESVSYNEYVLVTFVYILLFIGGFAMLVYSCFMKDFLFRRDD